MGLKVMGWWGYWLHSEEGAIKQHRCHLFFLPWMLLLKRIRKGYDSSRENILTTSHWGNASSSVALLSIEWPAKGKTVFLGRKRNNGLNFRTALPSLADSSPFYSEENREGCDQRRSGLSFSIHREWQRTGEEIKCKGLAHSSCPWSN